MGQNQNNQSSDEAIAPRDTLLGVANAKQTELRQGRYIGKYVSDTTSSNQTGLRQIRRVNKHSAWHGFKIN